MKGVCLNTDTNKDWNGEEQTSAMNYREQRTK